MICNSYCFSTATMVTRTRLSVTLYVHYIACLVLRTTVGGFDQSCLPSIAHVVTVHRNSQYVIFITLICTYAYNILE